MAQKKATVYILNVQHSMSLYPDNGFSKLLTTIQNSLEDRALIGRKTDLVSVLLCGTPQTDNILAAQTEGQYQHIEALSGLVQTDMRLLRRLANATTSNETDSKADVLDALIVAITMIRDHCRHLKYIKSVEIFTDAADEIDWRDLSEVGEMLSENNIELTVVGVDHDALKLRDCPAIVKDNYKNWAELIKAGSGGQVMGVQDAYSQTQEIYVKEVRPTPSFRGFLYLGDPYINTHSVFISINTYLRTKDVRLPGNHKYSGVSNGPTHNVEPATRYVLDVRDETTEETTAVEVEKENLQKGYKFGKSILIISEEEMKDSKLDTKKGMSIIGFLPADQFPRHYFYSNALLVTPGEKVKEQSSKALASLTEAMFTKGYYALVRFVTKDEGQPHLGVLQPEFDAEKGLFLQYFTVPFADDVRDYKFRSIQKSQVDDEGLELMDDLIDKMDIAAHSEDKDLLSPEKNFNPIAWRMNKAIRVRALNENSAVPDIDQRFYTQFDISDDMRKDIGDLGDKIAKHLNVKQAREKGKKRARGQVQEDTTSTVIDETPMEEILGIAQTDSRKYPNMDTDLAPVQAQQEILTIGIINPVQDFESMISGIGGDEDNIEKAVQEMNTAIFKLLYRSFGNQYYQKVHDCLQALRETSAQEDEASSYNKTIQEVKAWCNLADPDTPRRELWNMIKTSNLGLITNEECEDSDNKHVTREVAQKFWNERDENDENISGTKEDDKFDPDNMEDLF